MGEDLILASKSHNIFLMVRSPMTQDIIGIPGSLSLDEVICWKIELACSVKWTFLGVCALVLHFWVHRYLRNLLYVGTCLIASRRGKLTYTCLNNSSILFIFILFLSKGKEGSKALGYGTLGAGDGSVGSFLFMVLFFSDLVGFHGSRSWVVWFIVFLLLRVITDLACSEKILGPMEFLAMYCPFGLLMG